MGREIQQIIDDLLVDKASRSELNVLTNPSNVSLWYNLYVAFATQTSVMEDLTSEILNDINARALEIPVGTLRWYQAETLEYQHGDSLIIEDGIPVYAVEDDLKKVVKVSACIEQSGAILIKAAKLDVNLNPTPLSAAELAGLEQYWIDKRFAGVYLGIISVLGDQMNAALRIEVDGSKISSTGESQITPGEYPVEDAIKEYYRLLTFNGRFTVTDLIDAVQRVDGVGSSVVAESIEAKQNGTSSYYDIMTSDSQEYNPYAGYIIEDPLNLLRDTLVYIIR